METVDWVQEDTDDAAMYSIFNRDNNYWLNYGCVTIGNDDRILEIRINPVCLQLLV